MNSIFTHFIERDESPIERKRLAYAAWFTDTLPITEFVGDEYLMCEFLSYCVKLDVPVRFNYLQTWISTELRRVLMSSKQRVPGCETLSFDDPASFETIYLTTSEVLQDDFRHLETLESNVGDFAGAASEFFSQQRTHRLTQVLSDTYNVLNKTEDTDEAAEFALQTISAVQDIYDPMHLDDLHQSEDMEVNKPADKKYKPVFVTDCGLPAIDNDSQGLHTTQLFDVSAQSGTGKTRFVLGTYVYRALTVHKKNVLFCALEQSEAEVEAMLVAHHVFRMFNIQLSSKMVCYGTVPEEYVANVEAARYDLFESGKYGKFNCWETNLFVETFISKIRTRDKLYGPFDLICIDYMGLMESQPAQYQRVLSEYEIIKTSYRRFKNYLRTSRKAGISLSQFNREGVQAGKNDKEITTDMAQGGLAVYRNTDYNIAISMTETMRVQQKRRFSQPKVRDSAGFPSFIADTRLGFCYWKQVVAKEV